MKLYEIRPNTFELRQQEYDKRCDEQQDLPYFNLRYAFYVDEHSQDFKINEGMYRTLPRQDFVAKLKAQFFVDIYTDDRAPDNIIIGVQKHQRITQLIQMIGLCGWYISGMDIDDERTQDIKVLKHSNFKEAYVTLEPHHSEEIKTPDILYHITPLQVWEKKISKFGLSPKSKSVNSSHLERVYFVDKLTFIKLIAFQFRDAKIRNAKDTDKFNADEFFSKWAVLEIDTTKIPKLRQLSYFKVHLDTNMPMNGHGHAVYSQNYVPPNCIKLLKIINLDEI